MVRQDQNTLITINAYINCSKFSHTKQWNLNRLFLSSATCISSFWHTININCLKMSSPITFHPVVNVAQIIRFCQEFWWMKENCKWHQKNSEIRKHNGMTDCGEKTSTTKTAGCLLEIRGLVARRERSKSIAASIWVCQLLFHHAIVSSH